MRTRAAAAEALDLSSASRVLDLPTGTGQSLGPILERLAPEGRILGVDLSEGMLTRAKSRAERVGVADRVVLRVRHVHAIDTAFLQEALGAPEVDRLHVFLGLTAFPRFEEAFETLWAVLAPGGRAAVIDCHAETLGLQGRLVNLLARADIRRRAWEPLERLASDFQREVLPPNPKYGGDLWLATGTKPA